MWTFGKTDNMKRHPWDFRGCLGSASSEKWGFSGNARTSWRIQRTHPKNLEIRLTHVAYLSHAIQKCKRHELNIVVVCNHRVSVSILLHHCVDLDHIQKAFYLNNFRQHRSTSLLPNRIFELGISHNLLCRSISVCRRRFSVLFLTATVVDLNLSNLPNFSMSQRSHFPI